MDVSELKQTFKGEITTGEAEIEHYSRDASIFQIAPKAIAFPQDVSDVEALVQYVSAHKQDQPNLSITPRAGGTDMTGGSINDSIILDVSKHLHQIKHVTNDSVETESGVMFRDLEMALAARNRIMPAYPVSKAWCAVGGMVGNNAGGEKTFSYGQVQNFVQELEVVLADGKAHTIRPLSESQLAAKLREQTFEGDLYRSIHQLITEHYRLLQSAKPTTSKNSSGYFLWNVWDGHTFDLTKLFVGSQGTLGIITRITWKTVPIKRHSKLVVFFLKDLQQLGKLVTHVNELKPESFEIYDKHTLRLALRYLPEIIAKMKGSRLRLLWQFIPDLWLLLTRGLPAVVLLAEFTGEDADEVTTAATAAANNIQAHFNIASHITEDTQEAQKYWTIRRESYNLLRQHNARKISAPFIEDIVVHPDQLPEFMPKLDAILARYPDFVYTIAGHAGDANFHIIPLADLSDEHHRKQVIEMSDEVFNLVLEFKGSMTAEHNDGLVRGPFLKKMFGEKVYALFKETKRIFDPQNIFNPHKKTDADINYYVEHIRRN